MPGPAHQSDEDLTHQIGNIATTIFHPVGTCRMGQDDRAVVGSDLKVHGLDGLRVVDASIMPAIVSGNTASPVVMIAEKAADMIRSGELNHEAARLKNLAIEAATVGAVGHRCGKRAMPGTDRPSDGQVGQFLAVEFRACPWRGRHAGIGGRPRSTVPALRVRGQGASDGEGAADAGPRAPFLRVRSCVAAH